MKVNLLYPDREWKKPAGYLDKEDIIGDLNLNVLFRIAATPYEEDSDGNVKNMSRERDTFLVDTMKKVLMVPLLCEKEILYRQEIIKECTKDATLMNDLYRISTEAVADTGKYAAVKKEKWYRGNDGESGRLLLTQLEYLRCRIRSLDRLKEVLYRLPDDTRSEGMSAFIKRFLEDYNDTFQRTIHEVVSDIDTVATDGTLELEAGLGKGLELSDITVCRIKETVKEKGIRGTRFGEKFDMFCRNHLLPGTHAENIEDLNLLEETAALKNVALSGMMRFFLPFLDEQEEFFTQLHFQTAFYVGAINIYRNSVRFRISLCYPKVTTRDNLWFENLTELTLGLYTQNCPVANSLDGRGKHLVVVTGANQGGKSTYLRSIGIALVMFQCGLFVAASEFASGIYRNVFTHFTRREDSEMNSGRLDEELGRMEHILDNITGDSILFLNESFATTTEKEGSVIAMDITKALYEQNIRVMMVTHLLAFAGECYENHPEHAIFLAAQRKENGSRTYRIIEQKPELTSYGLDLYDQLQLDANIEN